MESEGEKKETFKYSFKVKLCRTVFKYNVWTKTLWRYTNNSYSWVDQWQPEKCKTDKLFYVSF